MVAIFLDIDGVLNDHRKWANHYSPILPERVAVLNTILTEVPEAKIILSSAWRYVFSTVPTIETLLACHGCDCIGRVEGATCSDEDVHDGPMPGWDDKRRWRELGLGWRAEQIRLYVQGAEIERYVVIDDLALNVPYLVRTDGDVGLTEADARAAIEILKGAPLSKEAA